MFLNKIQDKNDSTNAYILYKSPKVFKKLVNFDKYQ